MCPAPSSPRLQKCICRGSISGRASPASFVEALNLTTYSFGKVSVRRNLVFKIFTIAEFALFKVVRLPLKIGALGRRPAKRHHNGGLRSSQPCAELRPCLHQP